MDVASHSSNDDSSTRAQVLMKVVKKVQRAGVRECAWFEYLPDLAVPVFFKK